MTKTLRIVSFFDVPNLAYNLSKQPYFSILFSLQLVLYISLLPLNYLLTITGVKKARAGREQRRTNMNRVLEANVQRHHQPNKPTEEGQHNGGALLNQMENSPENAELVEYDPVKEMIEQQWNSRKQQADQVITLSRSMYLAKVEMYFFSPKWN